MVSHLKRFIPADFPARVYREPFLGAASLFLALQPSQAILSDLNADLIEALVQIRDRPGLVARYLHWHARRNSEEHYYLVRTQYNDSPRHTAAQAARFIYLNRTCFNGIFRVNLRNQFNVPYGRLEKPLFPSRAFLSRVAATLSRARLKTDDYVAALADAREGDFVYLDPPYPPLNGTSFFRHYTPERFDSSDQETLAQCVEELTNRGCLVMISNADLPLIRGLYVGFNVHELPVTRHVSSKKKKHVVQELIITNYNAG